jgi:putative membrane protein
MTMLRVFFSAAALAALAGSAVLAQQPAPQAPAQAPARAIAPQQSSMTAQQFTETAASSNQFEIESSKLASGQAAKKSVKDFAKQMVKDHTKAGKDLQAAAKKAGIQVPGGMQQQHQATLDDLRNARGAQFDDAYVNAQVQAHNDAVQLFTDYSKGGDNAELKRFATKALPTLKKHQDSVARLQKQQQGGTGGSAGAGGSTAPRATGTPAPQR